MVTPSPKNYPKSARLRATPEFQAVFKNGFKCSGVFFRLYFLSRQTVDRSRLGLAVPKKMAPLAVARNRIKRICRETFRQHTPVYRGDFVLVAQRQAKTATVSQLREELQQLLLRVCISSV
jgi:ribonuclease P protein component